MCHWVDEFPADAEFTNPHCAPAPMEDSNCHNYSNKSSCDDSNMCHWDAPDWMEDWQEGVCMSFNPCAIPANNNPDTCSGVNGCDWNWEHNECVEIGYEDEFCHCFISHSEKSCNDGSSTENPQVWELAPWCGQEEGDECDEMVCMVSMHSHDCNHEHFEFHDPCAEDNENKHMDIHWDEDTNTCTIHKSKWDV
jgi:hypothetical protein